MLVFLLAAACRVLSPVAFVLGKVHPLLGRPSMPYRRTLVHRVKGLEKGLDEFQEEKEMLSKVAPLFGRRLEFQAFAEDLLPSEREWPISAIQSTIEHYAKKRWPDCTVTLQGSAARAVHNKHFSDLDFALRNTNGILESELRDFCEWVQFDRSLDTELLQDSIESGKAIKLRMCGIDVDVACKDRLGDDGSRHPRLFLDSLPQFYREYPGALRAVRVAKYVFRPLKGLDIERIAQFLAKDSAEMWQNRMRDPSGLELFRRVVVELNQYGPDLSIRSPIEKLLIDARSQHGDGAQEYIKTAFSQSRHLAECILFLRDKKPELTPTDEEWPVREYHLMHYKLAKKDHQQPSKAELKRMEVALGSSMAAPAKAKSKDRVVTKLTKARNSKVGDEPKNRTKTQVAAKKTQGTQAEGKSFVEKVVLVFDDMLYCIETYGFGESTRLETKFVKGWCMGVDAFVEMATKTKKHLRCKRRSMPSGFHEVERRMLDLGVDVADVVSFAAQSSDILVFYKASMVAFLQWWKVNVSRAKTRR